MTKTEFNLLEDNQRVSLLGEYGICVDERTVNIKSQVKIYSIKNFFVEVTIGTEHNLIEKIKALETTDDWNEYMSFRKLNEMY